MRRIYTTFNHILTVTNQSHPSIHKHLMSHIVISYDKPLSFIIKNNCVESRGIIIKSGIEHTLNCNNQKHMLFLFDMTSDIAKYIEDEFLKGNDYYQLDDETINMIQNKNLFNENIYDWQNYKEDFDMLCRILHIKDYRMKISDKRIKDIIVWIKNQEGIKENIMDEILTMLNLSQSRVSHLFKNETGIALNSYIVLMKTWKAYEYVFNGDNVTDSALKAGFSSSNHFASTSKNMTGFSPLGLKRECIYCNFDIC